MPDDPAVVDPPNVGIPDVLVKLDKVLDKLDQVLGAIETPVGEAQESESRA